MRVATWHLLRHHRTPFHHRVSWAPWAVDADLGREFDIFEIISKWFLKLPNYYLTIFPNYFLAFPKDFSPFHPCKRTRYAGRIGSRRRRKSGGKSDDLRLGEPFCQSRWKEVKIYDLCCQYGISFHENLLTWSWWPSRLCVSAFVSVKFQILIVKS